MCRPSVGKLGRRGLRVRAEGLFCYATFELTSLSLLRHWTWIVVVVDVSWGVFVTAVSSTLGLMIANWFTPKG
jgi:uncharacterized membrane protein